MTVLPEQMSRFLPPDDGGRPSAVLILLGIVGLALAGTEFAQAVKAKGWKHAPGVAWHALLHGRDVEAVI